MIQKQPIPFDTNLFIHEPMDVYQSKRNDYLSSHQITAFLGPPNDMPDNVPDDVRRVNFLIGKATHSLVLEGRNAFNQEYTSDDSNVGNRRILTKEQNEMIEQMNTAVFNNPLARQLLGHGTAEGVVRASYRGFSCQVRLDWFHPSEGIVDLKTTKNIDTFDHDAKIYRYYHQFAFYRSVFKEAFGVTVPVSIIVVSNRNPICEVIPVDPNSLDSKTKENEEILDRMRSVQKPGTWAGTV